MTDEINLKKHSLRCVEHWNNYNTATVCDNLEIIPCSQVEVSASKDEEWMVFEFEFEFNSYCFEYSYPDYFEPHSCGSTRFMRHMTYDDFKMRVFEELHNHKLRIDSVEAFDTQKMYMCYADSGEFISEDDCLKMLNKFVTNGD